MAFKPTKEQELAIKENGNILVSAAAGSGKTAVLVERVISRLCDEKNGISADRLLIVTFTNAAAAEMRSRIEKRLDEVINDNPDNISLVLQKHLLASAKICTIDSFCIDLVRENFEKLGIAPDFKVSDASTLSATDNKVLSKIINRYLQENNPAFNELLDIIGSEFDEQNFIDFVAEIYNYSRQLPFPKSWFESLSEPYTKNFDISNSWYSYSFSVAEKTLKNAIRALNSAIELLTVSEKANNCYREIFCGVLDVLSSLYEKALSCDWDGFYLALENIKISSLPTIKGVGDIFEVNAAKDIYKSLIPKTLTRLSKMFFADSSYINSQFKMLSEPIRLLSDILIEYDETLFDEYTSINTYTFHNTEHLALKLLCEEKNGVVKVRPDATELIRRFDEVMVDEYQDTNDLQDMLFYVLSDEERKLFVVGDVKQSIYGFRGANPINFLSKKKRYVPIHDAENEGHKKIILGNNFRSNPKSCLFINFFFENFMNEEIGDIVYNDEEKLIPAAHYPETDTNATEIHLISSKGSKVSTLVLEGRHIAEYIKSVMNSGNVIRQDESTLRTARFSDFTILLRSAKSKAPIIANELKKQGIPVSYYSEEFIETVEISTFLSLLKIIDNPKSDVDLLTVLMSPIFAFSPEDMAMLRIGDRKGDIYKTVITAAKNGNKKAEAFLKALDNFRLLAVTNTLPKLISILLLKTGYLDTVSAFEDGAKRRNNLLLLNSYAEQFAIDGTLSLSSFLKRIEKIKGGLKAANVSSGVDSVKIMSIHASKGLQFPVCIVADIGNAFNDNEARQSSVYSTEFGIGFKYFDETEKTKITTIAREVILDKARLTCREEELRLLYVAMTRTQDKLLFVGTASDISKKADELKNMLLATDFSVNYDIFSRMRSYLDWLMLSLLIHPNGKELRGTGHNILISKTDSRINIKLLDHSNINAFEQIKSAEIGTIDFNLASKISESIKYKYRFEDILEIESKASVSKLANSAEASEFAFTSRPEFMNSDGLSAAGKGTAMHKVMQFFDFKKHNDIESELLRLYEYQFISEAEYKTINKTALESFFKSALFSRILSSESVNREMRFLTELPVKKIAPWLDEKFMNENIIVQGAVDVCFLEVDGIVVLDFKTDRVEDVSILADAYGEQLNIYAKACEKIFEMPVKQKIIYSFDKGKEIEV